MTSTDNLLEYRRTGGLAALDDRLVISQEGEATLARHEQRHTFQLSAEQRQTLQQLLQAVDFTKLAQRYPPERQGADLIEYQLTYAGRQVQMVDTTIPEALYPLLDLLDEFIAQAQ